MAARTEYFVSNGAAWNGANKFSVGPSGYIVGTANVSPYTNSVTLGIYVHLDLYFQAFYGMIHQIVMSIGSYQHVLWDVGQHCFGGCSNPTCGNPQGFNYTLTSTELGLAINTGKVTLTISVCGQTAWDNLGNLVPDCTLTQYIPPQYEYGSVTLTFLLPNGSPVVGMIVTLMDTSNNTTVGQATTNSSGEVTFGNLNVGDSFQAEFSYSNLGVQTYSFDLITTTYTQTVNLTCPSGSQFCGGQCVSCPLTFSLDPSTCQCVSAVSQTIQGVLTPILILAGVAVGGMIIYAAVSGRRGEV